MHQRLQYLLYVHAELRKLKELRGNQRGLSIFCTNLKLFCQRGKGLNDNRKYAKKKQVKTKMKEH